MTAVCPQGHSSATGGICDVCGAPIGSAATPAEPAPTVRSDPTPAPGPASPAPSTAGSKPCPNCHAVNGANARFCEDCGYDFATGQLPPPPVQLDPISGRVVPPAPEPSSATGWVAEVRVDPEWFAHQRASGSCPTSGAPAVVPLGGTVQLIGRSSRSRNINPEIDCSGDGAVSHRHAELRLSGERWSVKDLGSTNGTYVGESDCYTDRQLPPQQRRELADDERIYLGAWTRIVVRRATDAEKAPPSR